MSDKEKIALALKMIELAEQLLKSVKAPAPGPQPNSGGGPGEGEEV